MDTFLEITKKIPNNYNELYIDMLMQFHLISEHIRQLSYDAYLHAKEFPDDISTRANNMKLINILDEAEENILCSINAV